MFREIAEYQPQNYGKSIDECFEIYEGESK
jgi:hypothetical protein